MAIAVVAATGTTAAATALASTLAISTPTGVADGHVLIAAISIGNVSPGTSPTITTPTGWTALTLGHDVGDGGGGVDVQMYWKVWHTGDATSYSWNLSATRCYGLAMSAYSGVDTTTPIAAENAVGEVNAQAATHTTPSITTVDAGSWVVTAFAGRNASMTWTQPAGFTERAEAVNAGTSPCGGVSLSDSNGTVTTGAHTYVGTASASSSVAAMAALALTPSAGGGAAAIPRRAFVGQAVNRSCNF